MPVDKGPAFLISVPSGPSYWSWIYLHWPLQHRFHAGQSTKNNYVLMLPMKVFNKRKKTDAS